MKQLKADGDLNLGAFALKATKVTATEVVAKTLIGDGSKLTGIQKVTGTCANKGEVVKGIDKDGKLVCVKAMDPTALPADGLDEISNGQLSAEFLDSDQIAKAVPIADNNPSGAKAVVVVPDRGTAKKVTVSIEVSNSDFKKFTVNMTDPAGGKHVFFSSGAAPKSGVLKASFPAPDKPVSGDLNSWIGKNPKGTWTLTAIDSSYKDNKFDGEIKGFRIDVLTLSNNKVQAPGTLLVGGVMNGAVQLNAAAKEPVKCDATTIGYMYVSASPKRLMVCNGDDFFPLSLAVVGTAKNPAQNCKQVLEEQIGAKSGNYWVDPDGAGGVAAWQTWCDMDTDGGGWTRIIRHSDPNGLTYFKNADWDLGIARAAAGGIKQWLVKTFKEPAQGSAAATKPHNHWVMTVNANYEGSKFMFFKYKAASKTNTHRYSGKSYIDSTKLLPGACKSWHGSYSAGRQLWGEHKWNNGEGPAQMWMSHCGSPSYHMLIVNHNYKYSSGKHQTMVGDADNKGHHATYDEDGGAFEFFYR